MNPEPVSPAARRIRVDMETRDMVRVISTRGLEGYVGDLEGWASSEFNEATENLLDTFEVPVPAGKELSLASTEEKAKHPWGLPAKVTEGGGLPPVIGRKKPGPKKKERRLVPEQGIREGIRERLLAAKRKALGEK